MLKRRLIARCDIRGSNLIKTVCCEGVRVVGDPQAFAKRYNDFGIDEIIFLDVVASLYGRNNLSDLLDLVCGDVFVPVTVGGGVRTIADVRELLCAGADKVAVNTAAVKNPSFIEEIAHKFGSQCCVLQVDAKRHGDGWQAMTDGAREASGLDVVDWASQAALLGAGEILLTSVDHEGTGKGVDAALIRDVSAVVPIPVVASGGVGSASHAVEAFQSGADGVAMAGVLHYGRVELQAIRDAMEMSGIPVRRPESVHGVNTAYF